MTAVTAATLARKAHRTLEPLHTCCYFAPEMGEAYAGAGAKGTMRAYFAVRSAPMGIVPVEVVVATFYNFAPHLVAQAIPSVWQSTSPEALLSARYAGVDAAYRRMLGDSVVDSAAMAEAAELAREATTVLSGLGRPLFAGHAALPWPEPAHLQLFHAQTLLREHRGDGHIAALTVANLDAIAALVTHVASNVGVSEAMIRATRGWTDDEWDAGVARVGARGLVRDGSLTEAGVALRDQIEAQTDAAAAAPYEHLGEDRVARLRELARPWSTTIATELFGGSR
ncbi:MAG TPA: hypothetical protein VHC43_17270 [Mycobacteriales bacterium]|nr:hypothetical protein [Mycobacteriales bacterium]